MHAPPRRFWRPLRSFVILTCAAGAVLAADNTWLTDLRIDFKTTDWWSNIAPLEMPSADIAMTSAPANRNAPELSMSRLLNGLLFSKPSGGWRLDPQKTEFASTWMTQQGGDGFATTASSTSNYYQPVSFSSGFVARATTTAPAATTATGTWASNVSGNWSTAANWQSGIVADGAGNTANFNAVNFTLDPTITLDSSRTIGNLFVRDTDGTNHITIASSGGAALTFDAANPSSFSTLEQSAGSAGDTIAVNVLVKNELHINNPSASPFTISGNIASSASSGQQRLIFAGNIAVSGNISDGSTGANVFVLVNSGTVTLSGTNTHTGGTEVDGGTLLINGVNSGTAGQVYVYSGGTLGGTGTATGMNSNVYTFGGTITGGTATTVGTLTLENNLYINTGEGSGTYLANLSGAFSDLLKITGLLQLNGGSELDIVGSADGHTTYTLATFGTRDGTTFTTVTGIPSGYNLVYSNTDIELVPIAIPEPSTWMGGALALGAIGFVARRRLGRSDGSSLS